MSRNSDVVDAYMAAYSRWDHEAILALLADDVTWNVPGAFELHGKLEFDAEIEGDGTAVGPPTILVTRTHEAGDVVVSEGYVRVLVTDGAAVELAFCDVFDLRDGLITKLTSYLAPAPFPTEALPL